MRIFLFAQHYPVPYKSYYDTQFVDFIRNGHEVTIWAAAGLDRVVNEKVQEFALTEWIARYPTTLKTLPRFLRALFRAVRRDRLWAARVARVIWQRRESRKERIMQLARALLLGPTAPDICIVHELGTAVMFPFLSSVYPSTATALYYHGGETPTVTPLQQSRTAEALRTFDVVFSNTEFSCQHAVDRGCPADRIEVLPVGFAIEDFRPAIPRAYRADGRLQLLSAGRMSEEKGFMHALQAIKLLVDRGITDICYSLTGEGYLRPALEAYVQQHGLEPYVRFLGTLSTRQVIAAMHRSDALLLPSLHLGNWAENQACAVQEAMLMKAVVITTAVGGVPESIPEIFRRYSVPPADAAAISDAIAQIDQLSCEQLDAMGDIGRNFVLARYDVRRLNARLLECTLSRSQSKLSTSAGIGSDQRNTSAWLPSAEPATKSASARMRLGAPAGSPS